MSQPHKPMDRKSQDIELRSGHRPQGTPPPPRPAPILEMEGAPRLPPPVPPRRDLMGGVPDEEKTDKAQQLLDAVQRGDSAAVEELLQGVHQTEARSLVNSPHGLLHVSPLHLAAYLHPELVPTLLAHNAAVQTVDKLGRTALHLACSAGHDNCVALLLGAGADVNAPLHPITHGDSPPPPGGKKKAKTKWESWNKGSLQRRPTIRDALPKAHVINCSVGNELPVPECWGRTPLHQAVKAGRPACVKLLLRAGAVVDVRDEKGLTPLLLAGAGVSPEDDEAVVEYEEVVQQLVDAGADVNVLNPDTGSSVLHHAAGRCSLEATRLLVNRGADVTKRGANGETPLHEAAHWGADEVLEELLTAPGAEGQVNRPDHVGCTPLHKAAFSGARDCLALLLRHGGDLAASTHSGTTVLDAIFMHIAQPSLFLATALDQCLHTNNASVLDRSFKVNLDFTVLAPHGSDQQTAVMRGLLNSPGGPGHAQLLRHPLLEAFLRLKWQRLRVFFFVLIFIYVCFLFSLSIFVILSHLHKPKLEELRHVFRIILIFTSTFLLAHVLLQAILLPMHYLKAIETWVIAICVVFALVIARYGDGCAHHEDGNSTCVLNILNNTTGNQNTNMSTPTSMPKNETTGEQECQRKYTIIKHITSFTLLLTWTELMLMIGRFPIWGKYALMFYTVLRNVLKVLLTFVCIVLGFTLSFFVQYDKNPMFNNPWKSFVKTIVMMTGEFEYQDMFKENSTNPTLFDTSFDHPDRLPVTSRLIFLIFVIVASIVMMNLMVGLAVSDIQGIQAEGQFRRLLKQAEFVDHLEILISHKIFGKCLPKRFVDLLSSRRSIETQLMLQPSAVMRGNRRPHNLPYRLLESCVELAVKRRAANDMKMKDEAMLAGQRLSWYVDHLPSTSTPETRDAAWTSASAAPTIEELLVRISTDLRTVKDLLGDRRDTAPSSLLETDPIESRGSSLPAASYPARESQRSQRQSSPNRLLVPQQLGRRGSRRGSRFTDVVSEVQGAHVMLSKLSRTSKSDWP